jgi:hypothetical protein
VLVPQPVDQAVGVCLDALAARVLCVQERLDLVADPRGLGERPQDVRAAVDQDRGGLRQTFQAVDDLLGEVVGYVDQRADQDP